MGHQLNSRHAAAVDTSWRQEATCRFADLDLFFPAGTTGRAIGEIEAAKAMCAMCPVRDRCLQFALETNQEDGIWGGTTEAERRKLRRAWLAQRRSVRPLSMRLLET